MTMKKIIFEIKLKFNHKTNLTDNVPTGAHLKKYFLLTKPTY